MKEIKCEEYIDILFEIFKYVDDICKKNNIKYTLIGGSLIGAIRHSDIIPWDDDIDIAMTPENFKKFKETMLNQDSKYKYLDNSIEHSYYYPFAKVIDSNSIAYEENNRKISNYGVYIDVFEMNNIPNNKTVRVKHYKKITKLKRIFGIFAKTDESLKNEKNIIKRIRNWVIFKIGCSFFVKKYNKLSRKYNNKNTDFVLGNWPTYGYKHEILEKKYYKDYTLKKFRNIDAMVSSNYDEILKTVFGNYMELPPKEKRIPHHNIKAYWKKKTDEKK